MNDILAKATTCLGFDETLFNRASPRSLCNRVLRGNPLGGELSLQHRTLRSVLLKWLQRETITHQIYLKPIDDRAAETDYDRKYQEVAEQAAKGSKIVERVSEFVSRFNLSKKPVLEIGSGRGYLQDIAKNYIGARHFS